MANGNTRSMLIGAATALAAVYLTNKNNKSQLKTAVKNSKTKLDSKLSSQNRKPSQMTKTGFSDPHDPDDNRMVEEGAMTSVQYYNENVQDANSKAQAKQAFPKSQQKKLAKKVESLPEDNNDSPAKQENTAHL
ncbi:hypothetical protein SAMN05518871_101124 [Psychrobacillus sp. OK028]|uniref:hypothetical protein n=1 Tax=Psychrobacillus sp. OK028 TaxID=1884359 RepID=UPI000884D37F|nr:hypothetical protein [Psychrobacillus sp. OK028]SDM39852.1 hypothetical protein SAMN05518871_101124 [Psychrobacillus sp. OK028]